MNGPDLGLSTSCLPCSQELEKNPLLLLAEVSISQLTGFGYSVQMLNSPHSAYSVGQADQENPGSSCPLNGFSISHSPPTDRELGLIGPLKKDTQQKVVNETVRFKVTESSLSGESMPVTLQEAGLSERCKVSNAKCYVSEKRKPVRFANDASIRRTLARARYAGSEKGKEARARYLESDEGRLRQALIKARYALSERGKTTMARYRASDQGKFFQAIRNARSYAYRAALRQGVSEGLAREKGELAADKKRAALSSVSSSLLGQPENGSNFPVLIKRAINKKDGGLGADKEVTEEK